MRGMLLSCKHVAYSTKCNYIQVMQIKLLKSDELPKFDSPPVIETVLSVQFKPLTNFSNVLMGVFWKNYLKSEWDSFDQAPPISDRFERFGKDKKWSVETPQIMSGSKSFPDRIQILRNDGQRMLQIQNSRFILNWKKAEGEYPSYDELLSEFLSYYEKFVKFVQENNLGEIQHNQWEVTYVNRIPLGEMWNTISDINEILPWVLPPATDVLNQIPDDYACRWALSIVGNLGRLHIDLKHVRVGSEDGPEALDLNLTARGPIDVESGIDMNTGFNIGHNSIVQSFDSIISDTAKSDKYWKKR